MSISGITIRPAAVADLPALIAIYAADAVGGHGDTTDAVAFDDYAKAYAVIAASPREELYVAEQSGEIVGTFQTLVTTTLTGRGSSAMIIEAVQTRPDKRGQGIGADMIRFCIAEASRTGVKTVRLTSNVARTDAHRFYHKLGFEQSHLGFKMKLK
jgi:GNAT superfamily N-acetyltransferase